ncbi:E3 ubiquitin-protein ligase RNF213-like [Actinia tenebrosa]|uniref:E3 ubiquitin-protein ligase RNF213-like n=1 Tax=Actinia tenebrosa TaxID=6105 RepID=A0A6P8I8U6_ACTTE|nr:E3 ubiquitin-protein ligase RNF213-like [Actinia tenebrosa]
MAKENSKNNVETILFFDEVNTTEALDLVKEIMVDRRLNGRPLDSQDDGLRFIAACNPYRRHTDTMIKKLESAGLGYSVKTGNTTERIGCIPLRHLVYRVHALPDSMRSLIWDFGQLKPDVELLYTRQIVLRHVITEERIPGDESLVDAITAVLAASQQYMREQSDECSFVSLRDVERTMNVMVWFYEHREVFQKIAKEEVNDTYGGTDSEDNSDDEENPDYDDGDDGSDDSDDGEEEEEEDDDHEDESDSDSDGHVKENRNQDEEQTSRENEKPWPIFLFSGLRRSKVSQQEYPAELEPIPSGSSRSFQPTFSAVGNEHLPERPFLFDEIQDMPIFIEEEEEDLDDPTKDLDPVTWSLILAIGVCYHAKLQDRTQYRQDIAKTFKRPCLLYGGADRILQELSRCQKAVLKELDPGPNIACNTALSENVFMMVVCIELRIPLFVIGKPGSSKSLAKTVVADSMQGDASRSKLFKSFKEVTLMSHQCSPLSTPEGIQETFRQCANIQKDKNPETFASVVVLDEVGLAEDSPLMPLKTLHPLLEDGVTSSDDIIETDEKPTRVAFIGLSNWALDPAKMNRGIMLSRDVPNERELEDSAMGICASNEEVQELMKPIIPALAAAYSDLYQKQKEIKVLTTANKDEFFGLRDFYSLIKLLRVIAEKKRLVPDWRDVEYAVRRNFGGLDVDELKPVDIFMEHLGIDDHVRREENDQARDVSPLKLIESSLEKDSSEKDSRYLLILTENHAALAIVEQHLKQMQDRKQDHLDAVLIFGSSFPKDLEYTQVCRNINDIKVCMETGRTVILLNMESLYESLYDALNQYYIEFAGNRYVDLGLGTHRLKCRVHKDFRLIVIAEKDTVYKKFPIPLINRLEKHFLLWSTSLTKPQEELVATLKGWVQRFSSIELPGYIRNKKKFTEDDAFVGYHDDTIPTVVLQVCSQLRQDGTTVDEGNKDQWEEEVLMQCKRRLVQCCLPDAIVRLHYSKLQHEADKLWDLYFKQQQHSSLASFLSSVDNTDHQDGLLIQVSTHSKLLSEQSLKEIGRSLNLHHQAISCITLQQFQTEQQFCNSVGNFFAKQGGGECLLIVQCSTEDLTFNLLACARHHLLKQRSKITEEIHEDVEPTHIIVIIQLPKMFGRYPNFVGFQGQRWESVHIDELFTPSFYVPSFENVKDHSLSDLFAASIDMCFSKTDEEEQVLDAVDVLRQSVQAAAGRIEDGPQTVARATKRIVILLSLLNKDKSEELDENSFSHVLLRRVHHLLKEKDASAPKEGANWSTSESLESSELQVCGTYRKALWRRIQNAVVPILSEMIAYMDRDGNLELLQTDVPWIKDLWLKIFADDKLAQLNYDSFLTNDDERRLKNHVPVTSSGRDSHWFQCRLPFSWLLKENIESIWLQAKSVSENSNEHSIQECFQRFVAHSDIADEIHVIEKNQDAMERYIHDFVHMNCKPVEQGEDELIARALVVEAKHQHALSASHDNDFEFPNISLVHKAYSYIEHRIACFSQLVQCIPRIVPQLLDVFTLDENETILDVMALQMCLENLEPLEKSFNNSGEAKKWCDDVIAVRATAERTFNNTEPNQLEDEEKRMRIIDCCRPLWERLTAVRLFIEHVYPSKKKGRKPDPENIIKLCKVLDDKTDFSRASSIEAVELFLFECIKSFKKSSIQAVNEFRHHCNSFFMELISLLCFGSEAQRKSLDPEVFEISMRYITGTSSSQATKSFSPFPDFEVDKTPIVRSFLLQQLLTISLVEVRKYLQRYLSDAQALSPDRHHVTRVCQLVVDCIEDSTSSTLSQGELPTSILIGLATSMIAKGSNALRKVKHSDTLGIEALEAIARVRHALGLTAELLFKSHVASDEKLQEPEVKSEFDKLLNVVQGMCDQAPLVYLMKQLTRRYGASVIKDLTQDPEMSWLIPREFEKRETDTSLDADQFVVHNKEYTSVRDALARGLLSGSVDELSTLTQIDGSDMMSSNTKMNVFFLLSIYREITCAYREPRQQLQEYAELRKFFDDHLSQEARPLAVQLLDNSHGMGFTALSVQPAQPRDTIKLAELVVHTMVVLQCSNDSDVTSTLRSLLMNPDYMKNSFLPTMPEDDFQHVSMGLAEKVTWHVCPEGHRYSIGDCGKANQKSVCPECKSDIGGTGYKLLQGNAPLTDQNADRSNRGHILGNVNMDQLLGAVQPGRNLSPAVVHLIRLIMHSAMLVGACRHPQESCQIFSPPVEPERLNQFLWAHLTRDLRGLAAALNRNEDEALLTVHLVLAQITRSTLHDYAFHFGTGVLDSSRARRQWEEKFTSRFIQPVLSTLDGRIQACFDTMTNDSRVGTDPLMREIYEVDNSDTEQEEEEEEERLSPMNRCFWRYRPPITVEHAKQRFSEKMNSDKKIQKCKVLQHFFKEEYRLRVVRYLPNINKLHKLLTDRFYQRINQKHASEMTVKDFEIKLKALEKKEFMTLLGSFKAAWMMVRARLDKQGRYKLSSTECSMTIDDNSPMSILIPSTDGLGRCSLALVFYLVTAHNEFMETYFNITEGKARQDNKIRLSEVTFSQLVSYDADRDLLPLIQAHCHYSLEVGQGTLVEYDWTAIQRQLIDRFIRGKHLVEFEEPKFVFLRNNDADMFTAIRNKIEQENISSILARTIMSELRHLNEVCDVKHSLEIAMGFLASSGGSPKQLISEYLHDVLCMPSEKGLSSHRAEQCCHLKHIVHLWQLVTTQRAKILLRDHQDPFDEVQECFKEEIPRSVLLNLNFFLRNIDCSRFCGELLEMITFRLNKENEEHFDISLKEFFEWHMDNREATDVSDLPDDLLLKHSIKTWENVLDKSEVRRLSKR